MYSVVRQPVTGASPASSASSKAAMAAGGGGDGDVSCGMERRLNTTQGAQQGARGWNGVCGGAGPTVRTWRVL